jgi:hypothetical protein
MQTCSRVLSALTVAGLMEMETPRDITSRGAAQHPTTGFVTRCCFRVWLSRKSGCCPAGSSHDPQTCRVAQGRELSTEKVPFGIHDFAPARIMPSDSTKRVASWNVCAGVEVQCASGSASARRLGLEVRQRCPWVADGTQAGLPDALGTWFGSPTGA